MATTTLCRLRSEEIKPKTGSRVLNTKEELLGGELADDVHDLLGRRGVLAFKQLDLTDDEQIA